MQLRRKNCEYPWTYLNTTVTDVCAFSIAEKSLDATVPSRWLFICRFAKSIFFKSGSGSGSGIETTHRNANGLR